MGCKYLYLCDEISRRIREDALRAGMRAPSENELISTYKLSLTTIKTAYRKLLNDGIVVRRRGSGTYITEKAKDILGAVQNRVGNSGSAYLRTVHVLINKYENLTMAPEDEVNVFVANDIMLGINDELKKHRIPYYQKNTISAAPDRPLDFSDIDSEGDAVIMIHGRTPGNIRELRRLKIPFVVVNHPPDFICPCGIETDDRIGVYETVESLASLGLKKILYLGPAEGNKRFLSRLNGFRSAAADFGLDGEELASESGTEENARETVKEYLRSGKVPDAIVCATDYRALGAIKAAKEHGLSVPGDISVTGFDDIRDATLSSPPLTTVRKPRYEMGREAVLMLMDIFKNDSGHTARKVLRPALVIRQSTGKKNEAHS
jgi:LacI family transcriptional regulator